MIGTGASVLIPSSIWKEGGVTSDVWFEEGSIDDILSLAESFTDYYLKQMNFIGNLRRV